MIPYECPVCNREVELKGQEIMKDSLSETNRCEIYRCPHCLFIFLVPDKLERFL